MPRVGDAFERYRIEALLGQGGMGQVFCAYNPVLRRRVAVKLLAASARDARQRGGPSPANRLLREARAVAALRHPNIVAVYDVGEAEGEPYIVMEYVEGKTLRDTLAEGKATIEDKLAWLAQIAEALSCAHHAGIVHRDIKPDNVIIRTDGVAQVLDFGVAKDTGSFVDAHAPTVDSPRAGVATLEGRIVGTPPYMSPEQLTGSDVDARSDQFSWAVTAYETLAGVSPWENVEATDIGHAIQHATPPPLVELCAGVPLEIVHAVSKAMAKEPSRRFASMREVAAVLAPHAQRREESRPAGTSPAPGNVDVLALAPTIDAGAPPKKRRMARRWMMVLGVVVALGAAVTASAFLRAARPSAGPPSPSRGDPHALGSFAAGMQALRDANYHQARVNFRAAVASDDSVAAAHLRLAYILAFDAPLEARASYRRARELRGDLDARDQALLEACEPLERDPASLREWERSLRRLREDYAGDAEIAWLDGVALRGVGDHRGALAAFAALLGQGSPSPQGLAETAREQILLGRLDDARATIAACLSLSPPPTSCWLARVTVDRFDGDCRAVEKDAKAWRNADPESIPYKVQAEALIAQENDPTSVPVAQAIHHYVMRSDSEQQRRGRELWATAQQEILEGDFAQAESALGKLMMVNEQDTVHAYLEFTYETRIELLIEEGKSEEARALAEEYERGKDERVSPSSIDKDVSLFVAHAELELRGRDAASFEAARAQWAAAWREAGVPEPLVWVYGWASLVTSEAEAKEALAAQGDFKVLDPDLALPVGVTYALGGADDVAQEGARLIRLAASSCQSLTNALPETRGLAVLGRALERANDVAGACAAYGRVLRRWGKAGASSRTGSEAAARSRALGCKS